ncbi:MAG: hypothetical protein ACE5G5_05160 [Candidatus Methylomirabilales bacterium]
MSRGIGVPLIAGLLISGCATAGTGQGPPPTGGSSVGVGVSGGSGGVGVSSGVRLSPSHDPVASSTMAGAAIGALGGPIGLGVGALLGYLHGVHEKKQMEEEAQSEMIRQAQIDKTLELQIEAKRKRGSSGLIFLEDHLAPEREIASPSPASVPAPRGGLIVLTDHRAAAREMASTPPPAAPPVAGEGLFVLTDHLAPPAPPKLPAVAQTQEPSAAAATGVQASEDERSEEAEARRALDEQIATARERQRKLLEALQGTVAPPKTTQAAVTLAKAPPPTIDPDGFRLVHEGEGLARKERDVNGDGKPDIIRTYDETGTLVRQGEDSRLDGRLDTWTFYEEGRAVRKESDTNGDGGIDLWAFYDDTGDLVRTEADTDRDGHRDRVILYAEGEKVEEQHYRPGLDLPRLIIRYAEGQPARKQEDTDGDGRIDRATEYDGHGHIASVSRNPAGRGTFSLFAYYQPKTGKVLREEEDLNADGTIDVISHYEEGRLVRREFFDLPEVASLTPTLSVPQMPSKQETP